MSTLTPKYGLQFVDLQQASQDVPHNTALVILDAMSNLVVNSVATPDNTPPGSPANGNAYLLGGSPTGAWSGQANKIAFYFNGWYFVPTFEGLRAYGKDDDHLYKFNGTVWSQVDGGGGASIGNWVYTEGEFSTTTASPTFFYTNGTLFTSGQTGQAIVEVIIAGGNVGGAASTFGIRRKLFHVHFSGTTVTVNSVEDVSVSSPTMPTFTITQTGNGIQIAFPNMGGPGVNTKYKWSVRYLKGTDNTY